MICYITVVRKHSPVFSKMKFQEKSFKLKFINLDWKNTYIPTLNFIYKHFKSNFKYITTSKTYLQIYKFKSITYTTHKLNIFNTYSIHHKAIKLTQLQLQNAIGCSCFIGATLDSIAMHVVLPYLQ